MSTGRRQQSNAGTGTHFLAARTLAQRALWADAILLRPAAEMVLFRDQISSRVGRPSQTL